MTNDILLSHEDGDGVNPWVKRRRWQRHGATVGRCHAAVTRRRIWCCRRLVIGCTWRPDDGCTISQPLEVNGVRRQGSSLQTDTHTDTQTHIDRHRDIKQTPTVHLLIYSPELMTFTRSITIRGHNYCWHFCLLHGKIFCSVACVNLQ